MCACIQITPGNVLCHHSKHLMGYFKFLHGSRIICLCMSISEKLHWQYVSKKLEEAETHCLHLFEYDTIPMHPEEQHLPFKQTGTTIVFSSGYQSCNWPPSGPFCWQNLCSSCNSGTNLVVILEYTFFQLRSNTKKTLRFARFRRNYVNRPAVVPTSKLHFFFAWCPLFKAATFLFFAVIWSQW